MDTIEVFKIPYHPKYRENSDRCRGENYPCAICGKEVLSEQARYWVHMVDGGVSFGTEEYASKNQSGEMGFYPVGQSCYRKLPPEAKALVSRMPR